MYYIFSIHSSVDECWCFHVLVITLVTIVTRAAMMYLEHLFFTMDCKWKVEFEACPWGRTCWLSMSDYGRAKRKRTWVNSKATRNSEVWGSYEQRWESLDSCLFDEVNFHQTRFQVRLGYSPGLGPWGDQRQLSEGEFQKHVEKWWGSKTEIAPVGPTGPPYMDLSFHLSHIW